MAGKMKTERSVRSPVGALEAWIHHLLGASTLRMLAKESFSLTNQFYCNASCLRVFVIRPRRALRDSIRRSASNPRQPKGHLREHRVIAFPGATFYMWYQYMKL